MSSLISRVIGTIRSSRAGLRDAAIGMGGQAGTAFVGVLTSVLLARHLPPADVGTYALVISVVAFVNGLTDMGVTQTAVRFGSRAHQAGDAPALAAIAQWAMRRRLGVASVLAVAGTLFGPALAMRAWGSAEAARLTRIAVWIPVATQLASNVQVSLQASGRFGRSTVASLLFSGVNLAVLLFLVSSGMLSVPSLIVGTALAVTLSSLVVQRLVPAPLRLRHCLRTDDALIPSDLAPFARMMIVTGVTAQVLLSADLWILGSIVPTEEVAEYTLAQRFTLPLSLAVMAIGSALWPRIAAAEGSQTSRALAARLLRMALLGSTPIVAYSLMAPLLAPLLFGPHYRSSILLGQVLCLRYVVALFGTVVTGIGYNAGVGVLYPVLNVGRLFVLAAVGISLAPRLGALAFALGVVASEAFLVFATAYLVFRRFRTVVDAGVRS